MSERGGKPSVGAPFYAPSRRKTSAEIISEARAAIYGEMAGASSGGGSVGSVLRPLRTRRPFTPREPQRTLFTERRKKDPRPPSAFDLKNLTLLESSEDALATTMGGRIHALDEDALNVLLSNETRNNSRKKPSLRNQSRSIQERSGDGWSAFTKLPHLSGHSKPLHRRGTSQSSMEENKMEVDLSQSISVTRPLAGGAEGDSASSVTENYFTKSLSPDTGARRKQFGHTKSSSCDTGTDTVLGNIAVKHLAVQMPTASYEQYESMTALELAEALSHRSLDMHRKLFLMDLLQKILEKNVPANSLRELVLRSLYMHIDSDDERVLVAIARAMLTMRVTGTHLASACKLVFKIARDDKNDSFFRNTNLLELLVEGCGRADPVTEGECCVYGAGALRFLALEPRLCALAHRAGALHLAVLHLKILNVAKAENPRSVSEESTHALYQLTGALRNLAGGGCDACDASGERDTHAFVTSGALGELLAALTLHTDQDVLTNVARCLSVLSAEESCCAWLCASGSSSRAVLRALAACAPRAPLAVRLAYTLGNMAAADERARIHIYKEDGGIDVLLTILESYTKRNDTETRDPDSDPDIHLVGSDLCGSDGSNEDVLIKTVRVVANLCLTEHIGRELVEEHAERIVNALLACLYLSEKQPDTELRGDEQMSLRSRRGELATAALAALNNVTYYRDATPDMSPDMLDDTLDNICKATCRWVRCGAGGGAACEAVRALGNVSRAPRAAQLIVLEGILDSLPPYLQHEDASVRCAAAGVLVNVCGAGGAGAGGARAASLCACSLRGAAAAGDSATAALLTRALWNAQAHGPLSPHCSHQATAALTSFIDDESVFAACESVRMGERRASDPALFKQHVKFKIDNNDYAEDCKDYHNSKTISRALSVDRDLHLDDDADEHSGEDLGFEEGDYERDDCDCEPCRRLVAWEELIGVAIPLLERLKPQKTDASVGTD